MITNDIVHAMDLMIELCEDKTLAKAMDAMNTMLCNFDIDEWGEWTDEQQRECISKWLVRVKGE